MGKRGRRTKLTEELQKQVVDYIRGGAWDYIAAEGVGITYQTHWNWMRWGEAGNPTYRPYFDAVTKAHAEARIIAENWTWKNRPDVWLKTGPGRSKEGRDGWTNQVDVHVTRDDVISEIDEELAKLAVIRATKDASGDTGTESDGEPGE